MVHKNVTHFILIAEVCVLNLSSGFVHKRCKQPLITFTVNRRSQIFEFLEPHTAQLHFSGPVCFSVGLMEVGDGGSLTGRYLLVVFPHRLVKSNSMK